ncbi:MAG: ATP phosphoribosyltransferase regulatory subunit, partial [Candidatus Omnitrophica bacterium]|nr:ATP phosphoribosyltransferase regulatory subunit [Candidatus Omnitrophota bacterium]
EEASRKVFNLFGYREIRTPIAEETGLFTKSVGEETDIVKKEMFSFKDRGERDMTLRPEGTAPIVRAYLEHDLDKTEPFQRLSYIGPMFRAERPQAGRLRQFSQIGVEAIGSLNPSVDAEVIDIMLKLLRAIGVEKYELNINNLGCREDKKKLSKSLKDSLSQGGVSKLLCEDCRSRVVSNPLRVLDCKNEGCKVVVRENFKKTEFLCGDCDKHFKEVLRSLYRKRIGLLYQNSL